MIDVAEMTVAAAFATFGREATYTAPGGEPVACRIILKGGDVIAPVESLRVRRDVRLIDVLASEVSPAEGGVFAVAGESWRIIAAPRAEDLGRKVWTCEIAALAAS